MLPPSLPLFPLPTVVLFPNVFLPLHIFEPRYRQMVADALNGDRLIGMVLVKPGYEPEYDEQPPIYATGCMGLITHVDRLPDGRYNLVLRGLDKFTVVGEETPAPGRMYRRAMVRPIGETVADSDREALNEARRRLESLLTPLLDGAFAENRLPQQMPDEDLVNALAQYLEFDPIEKLALLERNGPLARCRSMVELLEMKALARKTPGDAGLVH